MADTESTNELPEAKKTEYADLRKDLLEKKGESKNLPDEFLLQYETTQPQAYADLKDALESDITSPNAQLEDALALLEVDKREWEVSEVIAFRTLAQSLRTTVETFMLQIAKKDPARYYKLSVEYTTAEATGDARKLMLAFGHVNEGFAQFVTQEAKNDIIFAQKEALLRSLFSGNIAFIKTFTPEKTEGLQHEYDAAAATGKIQEVQKVLDHSNEEMKSITASLKEGQSATLLQARGVADALRANNQADYPDDFLRSLQGTSEGSDLLKSFAGLTDFENAEAPTAQLLGEMDAARATWGANPGAPVETNEPLDPLTVPFDQLEKAYRPGAEHLLEGLTAKSKTEGDVFRAQYEEALKSRDNEFFITTYETINAYAQTQGLAGVPAPTFIEIENVSIVPAFTNPDAPTEKGDDETEFAAKLKAKPDDYVTKTEADGKTTLNLKVPDKGSRIQQIVGPAGSGAVVSIPEDDLKDTVVVDSHGIEHAWDGSSWSHDGQRFLVGPSYETTVVIKKKTHDEAAPVASGAPAATTVEAAPTATPEAPDENKLRDQTHQLLDQVFGEGKEAKLTPKIDAVLEGKSFVEFKFSTEDPGAVEDHTLAATLVLKDAENKQYKYSGRSVAHVSPEGYIHKKIPFPFGAAPDVLKARSPAPQLIELNMARRQALKDMFKNLAEGKTVA